MGSHYREKTRKMVRIKENVRVIEVVIESDLLYLLLY